MRILSLPLFENCGQLCPVGSDHGLFLRAGLDDHGNLAVVGADQCFASFKPGDGAKLCGSQLQHLLHMAGFIRLQIENDLVLGVVDDCSAVSPILQAEKSDRS